MNAWWTVAILRGLPRPALSAVSAGEALPSLDSGRTVRARDVLLFRPSMVLLIASLCQLGWTRPGQPGSRLPAASADQRLAYVVFEINGERRLVQNGDEIAVIKGDTIKVIDAELNDHKSKPGEVNVVGYQNPKANDNDDRGYAFSTRDLQERFSEDNGSLVYAIVVSTPGAPPPSGRRTGRTLGVWHGSVYLRLLTAVLRYAEISVNGTPRILREGDPFTVHGSDKIQITRVVTNLPSTADVLFQFLPTPGEAGGGASYAMRFLRAGDVFAEIPFRIRD